MARLQRYFLMPDARALEWVEIDVRDHRGHLVNRIHNHATVDGEPITDTELGELLKKHGLIG